MGKDGVFAGEYSFIFCGKGLGKLLHRVRQLFAAPCLPEGIQHRVDIRFWTKQPLPLYKD